MNADTIYSVICSNITSSEQIRWIRFNNFLLVDSILLVAWAAVFSFQPEFEFKLSILKLFCLVGIIFGILWAFLGWRTSKFLDDFVRHAKVMEKKIPPRIPRPITQTDKIRQAAKQWPERLTTSKFIVTWIPVLFSVIFLVLLYVSVTCPMVVTNLLDN